MYIYIYIGVKQRYRVTSRAIRYAPYSSMGTTEQQHFPTISKTNLQITLHADPQNIFGAYQNFPTAYQALCKQIQAGEERGK